MSRWVRAASIGLGLLLSFSSVLPAFAANNLSFIFNPPKGMTVTHGKPTNGLQLRSNKVRLDSQYLRQVVGYAGKERPGTIIVKYTLIVAGSLVAVLALYELWVRRTRPTRFLLGMRTAAPRAGSSP